MQRQLRGLAPLVVSLLVGVVAVHEVAAFQPAAVGWSLGSPVATGFVPGQRELVSPAGASMLGRLLGGIVFGGLLGGLALAMAPSFTDDAVRSAGDGTVGYFLWGLVGGLIVGIVLWLFGITIIGLIVAIPGAIAMGIGGLLATGVAVVWIGRWIGSGSHPVIAGALTYGVVGAIPIVGAIVTFVLNTVTFGVVLEAAYQAIRGWWGGR